MKIVDFFLIIIGILHAVRIIFLLIEYYFTEDLDDAEVFMLFMSILSVSIVLAVFFIGPC